VSDEKILRLDAHIYRNFDADLSLDVPAEGFGGWTTAPVELPLGETALVSMHAWDCRTPETAAPWYRINDYLPRADRILRDVFPPLLSAARRAGMTVLHVVGGGDYYKRLPAYRESVRLAGDEPAYTGDAPHSDNNVRLRKLLDRVGRTGQRNAQEMKQCGLSFDFAAQAAPLDGEGIAANGAQLNALCRRAGVSHLIYVGFAVNWCLLTSPAGMLDMKRRWYICSTIRKATTALENKESARTESHKEEALWRISTGYGFVFDLDPFIEALGS